MKHSIRLSVLLPFLLVASTAVADGASVPTLNTNVLGTRSIAACDPVSQACGVAVVSFPVTSSTIPNGRPGMAVASQMMPSVDEAQAVMDRIEAGQTPPQALDAVLAPDMMKPLRQVGVVALGPNGTVQVAQFTGAESWTQRCAVAGATYAVQAAGQTNSAICLAMAQGFQKATGSLALRLLAALKAGVSVGQDSRGERSASLRVWSGVSLLATVTPLLADASVSGKLHPLDDLEDDLYRYMGQVSPPEPPNQVTLTDATARSLKQVLRDLGYYRGSMDGRWNTDAEAGLTAFQANNVLFSRGTTEVQGVRKIDGALVQFILRADCGTLVRAP